MGRAGLGSNTTGSELGLTRQKLTMGLGPAFKQIAWVGLGLGFW